MNTLWKSVLKYQKAAKGDTIKKEYMKKFKWGENENEHKKTFIKAAVKG